MTAKKRCFYRFCPKDFGLPGLNMSEDFLLTSVKSEVALTGQL